MKQALKIDGAMAINQISDRLEIPIWRLKQVLSTLKKKGLVDVLPNKLFDLSTQGELKAQQLVRAHRLWETYLVNQVGLTEAQIHEDAEKFEHLLTPELLDQVDKELGYPEIDPHGSPIPSKQK